MRYTQSWQVRCLLRSRSVEDCRLIPDRLAGFCRLFSERLLRWREGSICCAVSRRFRNTSGLFRKTVSAFCCVLGRVRSASRHQGARGAREGRAGQESLEGATSRRDAHTTCLPVRPPPRARHCARKLGRMGQVPAKTRQRGLK